MHYLLLFLNLISWLLARINFLSYKIIYCINRANLCLLSSHTVIQCAKLRTDKLHRIINLLKQLVLSYKLSLVLLAALTVKGRNLVKWEISLRNEP